MVAHFLKLTFAAVLGATSVVFGPAFAVEYYVDVERGNDAWSGRSSAPVGTTPTDGPWQSLDRVSTATLLPGDTVNLACGHLWRETLRVPTSGATANLLRVRRFPANCTIATGVDGTVPISSNQWAVHLGQIYRAQLPLNPIPNGTFDSGIAGWRTWSSTGNARLSIGTSCIPSGTNCLSLFSGTGPAHGIAISPGFTVFPISYTARLSLRAPAGTVVKIFVRRDGTPWEPLGLIESVTGTGTWQSLAFPFRGKGNAARARLDIEAPANTTVSVDNVRLEADIGEVRQLFVDDEPIIQARHPNQGHDATQPQSPYLLIAQDSDQLPQGDKVVSSYLTVGSDLRLPAGAALVPGLGVRIRTNAWMMDERVVANVSGSRLTLDSPTAFQLRAGWGYVLTGALWMLDEPGEWFYDRVTRTVYVWMPDGSHPGGRVSVGRLALGVDGAGRSNVDIDGVTLRGVGTGIDFTGATASGLRNSNVSDTVDQGVLLLGTTNAYVENTSISRTGRDAILGVDIDHRRVSNGMRVIASRIADSGVRVRDGYVVSLPTRSVGAVRAGTQSTIMGNSIVNTGYTAIWPLSGSMVSNNYISGACLVLDDCAAVYVNRSPNDSVITGNLINGVSGAIHGKPSRFSQGQGIYLDDHATGVTVRGNTIIDADHGIQIHNASGNTVQDNKFYGNRRYQLWVQENSNTIRASGDIFDNRVTGNTFVPADTGPAVIQETIYSSTAQFATYDYNKYSGLLSPTMALESWSQGVQNYTFSQWRNAKAAGGVSRMLDANGSQQTLGAFAAYRVNGASMIVNGTLLNGVADWYAWNPSPPLATVALETCSGARCLKFTAGNSQSLFYTSTFAVTAGQWYRVSFDMKTGVNAQAVVVGVRRGGGGSNGYEWLMSSPRTISGTTAWGRYTFSFQATKTIKVNDPVTLDSGARLDFQLPGLGQTIWVRNAEMVQLSPVGATLKTRIIVNPSVTHSASIPCPEVGDDQVFCSRYVKFSDSSPLSWPYALPPLGSEIIYSRGDTLTDADADGIGDAQDACPATGAGQTVNSKGCSIDQ